MAEPKLVIGKTNNSFKPVGEAGLIKKLPLQSTKQFKAKQLLADYQPPLYKQIANTISQQSHKLEKTIDTSKYNDVLKNYNKQAVQNNCKGQCHDYEAGFEEEKEFNSRMQEMHKRGNASKGHALTYRETNWLWKFGNGKDIYMDGNVIKPLRISENRVAANPFPRLDDLKVHGSVTPGVNNKDRIYDGLYDFDIQENLKWNDFPAHARNILNEQAIEQHGAGQPFMIKYDYGDRGKVK